MLLLQSVPGHFLGRLVSNVSCALLDEAVDGEAMLQPTGLAPGPLGIASAACDLIQVVKLTLDKVHNLLKTVCLRLRTCFHTTGAPSCYCPCFGKG